MNFNFEGLLQTFLDNNNQRRKEGEEQYATLREEQPNDLVSALVHSVVHTGNVQLRAMSVILLRRAVIKGDLSIWSKLSGQTQEAVKGSLIASLENETEPYVRTKVNDTIADLAATVGKQGGWPQLLDEVFKFTKSNNPLHRDSALAIFGQLLALLPEELFPHFSTIRELIQTGMRDNGSLTVRVSAMIASTGFITNIKNQYRAEVQSLVPDMLKLLEDTLSLQKEQDAVTVAQLFSEWAERDPTFFQPYLNDVVGAMLTVAKNTGFPDAVRQQVVEVLTTLCEKKAEMMFNMPGFLKNFLEVLLNFMVDMEDVDIDEWNDADNDDGTEITNQDVAEGLIDRVSKSMGDKLATKTKQGNEVVHILLHPIGQMINNAQDWRQRHAGLMSLALIAEGSFFGLKPHMNDALAMILPRCLDNHPRVRWAAANSIGQLCNDYTPIFQREYHQPVLDKLIVVMGDNQNPRVQAHACAALTAFYQKLGYEDIDLVLPYLDGLLKALYTVLSSEHSTLLEESITAIACLATLADKHFDKYYGTFMPAMKEILRSTHGSSYLVVRGKTIECISLIGVAVGPEVFSDDAHAILSELQHTRLDDFDTSANRELLMHASARFCKTLGRAFVPFLPTFMPIVLKLATMSNQDYLKITSADDTQYDEIEGWDVVVVRDRKIGIHQSALEEKCTAVQMLFLYTEYLQEDIHEYIEQITQCIIPLLIFTFHKGTRSAAATTCPILLTAMRAAVDKKGRQMGEFAALFEHIYLNLIDAAKEEVELPVLAAMIAGIEETITAAPENVLSIDQIAKCLELVPLVVSDVRGTRAEREQRKQVGDYDEQDEEEWAEEETQEDECITELAEIIGALVRRQTQNFMPAFQPHLEFVMELVNGGQSITNAERQLGFCIACDLVENTKSASASLIQFFLPSLLHGAVHEYPGIRQAAVYGLGVIAENCPEQFAHDAPNALQQLLSVITPENRESQEYANPTENAICAVGKIIMYHRSAIPNAAELMNQWLQQLPLTHDKVEARSCHGLLCTFIEKNDDIVWGQNFSNLPQILSIFTMVVYTKLFTTHQVNLRIYNILTGMAQSGTELFNAAAGTLTPAEQDKLRQFMAQPPREEIQ